MNARTVLAVSLTLVLLFTQARVVSASSAYAPDAGPCVPGASYDPACDVDHDGDVDVTDVMLTAGHFDQTGTWMSDNNHDHLGQTWVGSNNPLLITGPFGVAPNSAPLVLENTAAFGTGLIVRPATEGIRVESGDLVGINVENAGAAGLHVGTAGVGVAVNQAANDGVYVGSALDDGINICQTGSALGCTDHPTNNGVEIGNAENHGVRAIEAGSAGLRVDTAGGTGVYLDQIGGSGMYVENATNDGLHVNQAGQSGVYVGSAINGINVNSASMWAGTFGGNVNISGTCTGCLLAQMAINAGDNTLEPGDVVAVAGIDASSFDSLEMLMRVRKATPGSPLVGVVSGRAEPFVSQEDGTNTLVPRNGEPVAPGDYLSVVIYGPVQVKASAAAGSIQVDQRLTAAEEPGFVRAQRVVEVEGVKLAESTSTLGVALESLDAGEGLIWVLVNVQ